MRGRELKLRLIAVLLMVKSDAPYAGARIETSFNKKIQMIAGDALYAGARIETLLLFCKCDFVKMPPMRRRELKHDLCTAYDPVYLMPPMRGRELKPMYASCE